jgi:hypothetical protein
VVLPEIDDSLPGNDLNEEENVEIDNAIPPANEESLVDDSWLDRIQDRLDNRDRYPDEWNRIPDRWDSRIPDLWDSRIPDRRDPLPPRFPRDPILNTDRLRDRREPVYVPPSSDMIRLEEWEIRDILDRRDRRDQRY